MKRTTIILVIVIITIVAGLFYFLLNRKSDGIPHGIYERLNDMEEVLKEGPEAGWDIRNNKAEHRYIVFEIVNVSGKLYFEVLFGEESKIKYKYEVTYDNKTKILSVNMPVSGDSPSSYPTNEGEMKVFKFKKTGISIG